MPHLPPYDPPAEHRRAIDLTPRLANGDAIKVRERADRTTEATLTAIAEQINTDAATAPGDALFLGLENLRIEGPVPVYVVAGLLDTIDPLDLRQLGWDVAPKRVVADLRAAHELPDLSGVTDLTFVVRGTAGDQEALREPQRRYLERLWRTLATASGAQDVHFEYADGNDPLVTTQAPTVPIPLPPTTPVPLDASGCVVDTSAYFRPDAAAHLDRAATERALAQCVAGLRSATAVTVTGHTAGAGARQRSGDHSEQAAGAGGGQPPGGPRGACRAHHRGRARQPRAAARGPARPAQPDRPGGGEVIVGGGRLLCFGGAPSSCRDLSRTRTARPGNSYTRPRQGRAATA
jgi:hypothetical protein